MNWFLEQFGFCHNPRLARLNPVHRGTLDKLTKWHIIGLSTVLLSNISLSPLRYILPTLSKTYRSVSCFSILFAPNDKIKDYNFCMALSVDPKP